MGSVFSRARSLARIMALIPIVLAIGAAGASAAPILVTFDNDTLGMRHPDGFTSSDSALIHFSDTVPDPALGQELFVVTDPIKTAGSNALAVFRDGDDSALLIEFDFLATALSMDLGNDNPAFSQARDAAVLTAFLNGAWVGEVSLALNRDSVMNQRIFLEQTDLVVGETFNSATLKFDVNPALGLTEFVDNVTVTPIPEPQAAIVFGVGALLVGAACRRRSRVEVGLGARRR